MTAHAAELGRVMHGAAIATLQSSAMGFSVYERMGYRTVTDWQVWTPPSAWTMAEAVVRFAARSGAESAGSAPGGSSTG